MPKPVLQFFLSPEAKAAEVNFGVPRELDAGFDLPSLHDVTIEPGTYSLLHTGIHLTIPEHWVGIVRDRSSIASRGGLCGAGVIDASYRGEVKVLMHNLSKQPLSFKRGDRIAQCVVLPHLPGTASVEVSSLDELGATERGSGGFGSTGR